ncbi:UDP-N-acetylmuramoyl-tripeptide--D-alanyl-D-alanine ligase [Planctomycetota bacterium]
MKEFPITELVGIIGAIPQASYTENHMTAFTAVSIDSRTMKAGDCFFAIAGENFDGHDYVSEAFAKGAVCAVVSKEFEEKEAASKCLLRVEDTVQALGDLAREYRRQTGFKVVSITGSVGKTTTRQIIYHALSRRFRVHQSPASFNNKIGLPLTLLGADHHDQIVITELGSNHPGEISHLTRIAEPDIAIVTNVHPAHLEGFGDLQTIVQEKSSITEGLRSDGIFIINGDFEVLVNACRAKSTLFKTFGKSDGCDYQAKNIRSDGTASRFTIEDTQIILPLAGPGNVENTLAAWAVCHAMDLGIEDFTQSMETLSAVSMRAEVLQIGTLTVLNDCYNANPASMKNALSTLAQLDSNQRRRKIFICGDMAELGEYAERLHAELGKEIVQARVRVLLAVGRLAKIAAEAAEVHAEYDLQVRCFTDAHSACQNLHEFIADDDIILVKGSRTAGLEGLVDKLKELFPRNVSQELNAEVREAR